MTTIKKLQQRIDELIVQIDLGKLEAIDHVEESKKKLGVILAKLEKSVSKPLKEKSGELRLQLHLGKMETKEAWQEQCVKIGKSVDDVSKALKDAKHEAAE